MRRRSLSLWIRENREALDVFIHMIEPMTPRTDEARREWVFNCDALLAWAQDEQVEI
jgi:hypothetical protein